jgi:hypothetical protein
MNAPNLMCSALECSALSVVDSSSQHYARPTQIVWHAANHPESGASQRVEGYDKRVIIKELL